MGDRTTPMKFGPEWLRNLSREPTSSGSQASGGGAQSSTPASRAANLAATATATTNNPPNTSKVLLAKLRYGREEILALYDRQTAEAPQQLKSVELLYHPRGKPPYALNNNFEDDTRDMRNNPAMGGMGPTDRYGLARGRGMSLGEGRGRATISEGRSRGRGFVRQTSLGSDTFRTPSWHNGGQRTYPGAPEDDPNPSRGLWNTGNGSNLLPIRANMEVAEWASKMAYRKNRQNHTNWRQQQNRDEGEEWRSSEGQRRGQEKWEREWPERSNQDKPWTSNRRQWGGDNNDDALPEWAVENSEACAGTFDSSGAFHGYSIDDSDLPKTQESYPLARSHTHGGVPRSRTAEEGSEEWWASEKAKKLSAKRFDATKSNEENDGGNATSATNTGANTNTVPTRNESKAEIIRSAIHEDPTHDYGFELQDEAAALPVKPKQEHEEDKPKDRKYHGNTQPSAQQRIDMLLRADKPDTTTERKDHTSVMMAINTNRLRLRHQNIGSPTNEPTKKKSVLEMMVEQQRIKESQQRQQEKESKLVDDMLDMHISEELQSQLLNSTTQAATMVNPVTSMANKLSSPVMKMRMSNPSNQAMGVKQQKTNTMSTPGHQQGTMMRPILGISNSMLNASLGLPVGPSSNISMPPPLIQNPGMLSSSHQGVGGGNMQGSLQGMQTGLTGNMQVGGLQTGLQVPGIQGNSFKPGGGIPGNMQPNIQSSGIHNSNFQSGSGMPGSRMPGSGMPGSGMPGSGMAGSGMAGSGMAGSGMPGSGIPGSGMPGSGMLGSVMSASGMPGFQGNNSLFMQGASNNMQNPNDMSNHGQQNMYQMHGHGMQQPQPQSSFNRTTIFSNMMQPVPNGFIPNIPLMDQWFYEDPKKNIQGPFTTNEMNCWYRAGFFNSELMVRRACESNLRPLATYGPMPFGAPLQEAMTPAYTIRFYPPATPLGMGNTQQAGLGPDVESLWSQPTTNDLMWLQQRSTSREDDNSRVNNLSMYFWDQPSGMSNALLPEGITKEMKTEDEILAQMRAAQGEPAAQDLTFMTDVVNPEDAFTAGTNIAPNLEELQKLIGSDIHVGAGHRATTAAADADPTRTIHGPRLAMPEKISEHVDPVPEVSAKPQLSTKAVEVKTTKQPVKVEEKTSKNKEITVTKAKTKKQKEDKKEDAEVKDGDCKTTERRSEEPSQPTKKEDKANKKELEKEKKEWLKDGFTIVKGAEKKDSKKKEKEEARAAEEAEKKRKEDEKRALLEAEKNRAPEPVTRRQQLEIGQVQKQVLQPVEPAPKKAPWSAQCASRDGPALADIQRLEREKKLEQMKEQQLMMQAIAQQQAEAAQREQQEMQAGQLGWAKKKQPNNSPPGQTLAEIQAEARKQAAAMSAAASAAAREEAQAALPPPANVAPWGATNGGGFWDSPACATPLSASERSSEAPLLKTTEPKPKKKVTVMTPPKKDTTPSADFETWCTNVLSNWRDAANIDIPTFVAFLRDIESPYEVKDYVKCYLGDTKDSNDFSRQFLERRSRLLRVGMVTPSDDLCSPAAAINPRTNSGSDYTEVKAKGIKKTKKNKMLKIDARILGFSVTASEDRINVGDIDSV